MGSFWDELEEEHYRKRAANYIDNQNLISWLSLFGGFMFFLIFFVFIPTRDKNSEIEYAEFKRNCHNTFYEFTLHGVVKGKEYVQGIRTDFLTIETLDSNNRKRIDCRCNDLYEIYKAVEMGDTILKPADTLLVKIYNSPKYEELNRYETYRKK